MNTPPMVAPRALVVDGTNILLRAHYARNRRGTTPGTGLATAAGRDTSALYGAIQALAVQARRYAPTHVVWTFDRGNSRSRRALHPGYKAARGRPGQPVPHTDNLQTLLRLLGIPYLQRAGLEADDMMAAAARELTAQGAHVALLTTDHDLHQLVSEQVTVIRPSIGPTKELYFDPKTTEDRYGVPAAQLPELWAMQGDPGDSIPGVPGVGPSTARKILAAHGTLWAALEAGEGKLADYEEDVRRNYRLISLHDPPPIHLPLSECVFAPTYTRGVAAFLDYWEMHATARAMESGALWGFPREGDTVAPRTGRERVPV